MDWDEYISLCFSFFNNHISPPISESVLRRKIQKILSKYGTSNWRMFERHIHSEFWTTYCKALNKEYPSYIETLFKNIPNALTRVNKKKNEEARESTFGWVFQYKYHIVYGHINKAFIICVSYDNKTGKVYFLLAKDRSSKYPLQLSARQQKSINMRDKKTGYRPKWGLLGGKKHSNRFETCFQAAAREFTEESLGVVMGNDYTPLAESLSLGSYYKRIIMTMTNRSGHKEQYCFFIKEIPYNPNIREKHLELFNLLYDIYTNKALLPPDLDHPAITTNQKYVINRDYLEKEEIDWFTLEDMIHMKDEMKEECSIIEYVWAYVL